jgi:hypothetical protein
LKVEKKFQKGDIVMLPVTVDGEAEPGSPYDYNVSYEDTIVGGRNPLFVRSADIMEASNIDWERKYHEAEAEIATLKEVLERNRNRASKDAIALEDYRYVFKWMPEWREYILHEMCERWRALEE